MEAILGLVVEEELRTGKKNPYWQFTLRASDGNLIRSVIWDIRSPEKDDVPRKGEIIGFNTQSDGVRDQRDTKWNNIVLTINSYKKVPKESVDPDILTTLMAVPRADPDHVEHALGIITDAYDTYYQDDQNRQFVRACLNGVPRDVLATCPAAKSIHHAYQGGLAIHTSEVILLCHGMLNTFPWPSLVDSDVVYAGAALHDIGKAFTYGTDELGMPAANVEEYMVGHTVEAIHLVKRTSEKCDIDPHFVKELIHVIASHHGKREYGAFMEPGTLEAMMVSQADLIGSRAAIIDSKVKYTPLLGDEWQAAGGRYFTSRAIRKMIQDKAAL